MSLLYTSNLINLLLMGIDKRLFEYFASTSILASLFLPAFGGVYLVVQKKINKNLKALEYSRISLYTLYFVIFFLIYFIIIQPFFYYTLCNTSGLLDNFLIYSINFASFKTDTNVGLILLAFAYDKLNIFFVFLSIFIFITTSLIISHIEYSN